jgi:hypothetical protein
MKIDAWLCLYFALKSVRTLPPNKHYSAHRNSYPLFIERIVAMFMEDKEIDECTNGEAVLEQLKSVMKDVWISTCPI